MPVYKTIGVDTNIIDAATPRHAVMSGRYRKSFAYITLRRRLPAILSNTIDHFSAMEDALAEKFGEDARDEVNNIIEMIVKLKIDLQMDQSFQLFSGLEPDKAEWNAFISDLPRQKRTFFKSCWLHSECYLYRRLYSFIENSRFLKGYDYFASLKEGALELSVDAMISLCTYTRRIEKSYSVFSTLIKINLWGNRFDLSITEGKTVKPQVDLLDKVSQMDRFILVNNIKEIWNCLNSADRSDPVYIDIICDNAGFEIFTDFLLAEFLIDKELATMVRFHVKAHPWFISDTTERDFYHTMRFMKHHENAIIQQVGRKWKRFLKEGKFELAPTSYFWTGPQAFFVMRDFVPELYRSLARAQLLIFKGDLNYRKLLGDFTWDSTEEFITCLRGFRPTNVCAMRTVKADVVCGLPEGVADILTKEEPQWMISGKYGLIQYTDSFNCRCWLNDE